MSDPYRDWSYADRRDAWDNREYEGCRKYDEDSESSDRAYENWRNGGSFQDPDPNGRFG